MSRNDLQSKRKLRKLLLHHGKSAEYSSGMIADYNNRCETLSEPEKKLVYPYENLMDKIKNLEWELHQLDNMPSLDVSPVLRMKTLYTIRIPESSPKAVGSAFTFLVEMKPGILMSQATSLIVTVKDPRGNCVPTMQKKDLHYSHIMVHTFMPTMEGCHIVSVTDTLNKDDIEGSPFYVTIFGAISRERWSLHRKTIFAPTQTISPVKAWGISSNPETKKIYTCDRATHCVKVYSYDGTYVGKFGKQGAAQNEFFRPTGIAVDCYNSRLIISDKDNHRIVLCSLDGKFLSSFGGKGYENGLFNYPWGVAVSPYGEHIVVADSRNHRIQIFDRFGNFLNKFSVFEKNPFEYKAIFNYPRGVTFSHQGDRVYVTDFNLGTIHELTNSMQYMKRLVPTGVLNRPQGIASDSLGNIAICNGKHNQVHRMAVESHEMAIEQIGTVPVTNPVDVTYLSQEHFAVLQCDGAIQIH